MAGTEELGRSVMDEMMALFTPPGRETKTKHKKFDIHPYFRRPGKGHNHDSCDACGEGGDLICCDNCPASFHFSCHAPPLQEEDIPMGDWICLRCYHREQKRLATIGAHAAAHHLVGISRPADCPDRNGLPMSEEACSSGNGSANSTTKVNRNRQSGKLSSKKQLEAAMKAEREKKIKVYRKKYDNYLKLKPITNSPFDALIAATQVANAEQFKLPKEYDTRETLPLSWKWADERVDDLDTLPRTCFMCRKTSRGVPAVACDFCPSVFHLDCLDPPLCEIPKERWMCPNHVQHFLDSHLVTSTSLTERLKLWQRFARAPVHSDAVRLEFFRKVRSGKLFQRCRTSRMAKPPDFRVQVPQFIKDHYKNRMEAFPVELSQPPEFVRKFAADDAEASASSKEEQHEWLLSLIALQKTCLKECMAADSQPTKQRRVKNVPAIPAEQLSESEHQVMTNGRSPSPARSDKSVSTASECSLDMDSDDNDSLSQVARDEIKEYLSRHSVMDMSSLDPLVVRFLASQKLKEVFSSHAEPEPDCTSEVRVRASLVPLYMGSKAKACLMRYRTMDVGLGANMTLDLSSLGRKCQFVSTQHASIFFDQYNRVFELINYSDHGTVVDNVIYSVEKRSLAQPQSSLRRDGFQCMSSKPSSSSCRCSRSPAQLLSAAGNSGCESSAILHHGSYVRFGCLQFIFCIWEYDSEPSKAASAEAPL